MTKKQILKKLEEDEHYYGKFGQQYLSNSNIKTLFEDPMDLRKETEKTPAMVFGGYLHTVVLEPDKVKNFRIVESSTRNTNKYKEISQGELLLLEKEADLAQELADKVLKNDMCKGLIRGDYADAKIEYEIPNINEYFGNQWKCKADILNHDEKLVIDLKTTGDIDRFRYSADKFNYDSQAYIYSRMFGYKFIFIVICKKTKKIGIFDCSEDFLYRGEQKLVKANEIYDLFYKDKDFEPEQYIELFTL